MDKMELMLKSKNKELMKLGWESNHDTVDFDSIDEIDLFYRKYKSTIVQHRGEAYELRFPILVRKCEKIKLQEPQPEVANYNSKHVVAVSYLAGICSMAYMLFSYIS